MVDNGRLKALGISDERDYPPGSMIYHKLTVEYLPLDKNWVIHIDWSKPNDYREIIPEGVRISGNTMYFPDTMTEKEAVEYMISHLMSDYHAEAKKFMGMAESIRIARNNYIRALDGRR